MQNTTEYNSWRLSCEVVSSDPSLSTVPQPLSESSSTDHDNEFSHTLRLYLQNMKSCGRKKQRRCISRELG